MRTKMALAVLAASTLAAGNMSAFGGVLKSESTPATSEAQTEEASAAEDEAQTVSIETSEYYFGKINVPYADFYYGEINHVQPEALEDAAAGQYDAEDKVTAAVLTGNAVIPCVCGACFQCFNNGKQKHTVGGFELYRAVRVQKACIQIFIKVGEHGAVFHVMAVNNQVGAIRITSAVKERHAALAVLAVEITAEIFLRVVRCVHNGITDACAVDAQPAEAVAVCGNERR